MVGGAAPSSTSSRKRAAEGTDNADQAGTSSDSAKKSKNEDSGAEADDDGASGPVTTEFALKNLHVRKIVKENHGGVISALAQCKGEDMTNIVASVGATQANVYDNAHLGANLDLFQHFVNAKTEYAPGGNLLHCAWLESSAKGDAYLAVAGEDCVVQVLSLGRTKVVAMLQGHGAKITNVATHGDLLLSAGEDKTVRLWAWRANVAVAVFETAATALAFVETTDGLGFLAGAADGTVRLWKIGREMAERASVMREAPAEWKPEHVEEAAAAFKERLHDSIVDCISTRTRDDGTLVALSKARSGRIKEWSFEDRKVAREIRVPYPSSTTRSLFGLSSTGRFLASGNDDGVVYIYDLDAAGSKPLTTL